MHLPGHDMETKTIPEDQETHHLSKLAGNLEIVTQLEHICTLLKDHANPKHLKEHNASSAEDPEALRRAGIANQMRWVRAHMGLQRDSPLHQSHIGHHHALGWGRIRYLLREPFAEFWGMFIMIFLGNGIEAQVLLSANQTSNPGGRGAGNYNTIMFGWAVAVMLGIFVAGDGGGFLNPAITFTNCLYRRLPWRRFPIYFTVHVLGGFLGAAAVYGNYISAINAYEGRGIRTVPPAAKATGAIFCTYPQSFMTKTGQFFAEFTGSAVMMFILFSLRDESNPGFMGRGSIKILFPIAMFFLVLAICASLGWETGLAVNVARDLGPRLLSYALGYGKEVWTAGDYWFWVPIVSSFLGCAFGGFLYDLFIYTGPETPLNTPWLGLTALVDREKWAARFRRNKTKENYSEA